ncbi:MAG: class I SAM-dependent methyltransferase [Bacilli bacterium]|nr:class I SAM-dependent methyltransferase [Bacilli bacterium]
MEIEKVSKAWDWSKADAPSWLEPAKESFYLLERWKKQGKDRFMDYGCGLGRHSLFFASNGFKVKAFDLSDEAVDELKAKAGDLTIEVKRSDMHHVDYPDGCVDCLLAYHVVSHTDEKGIRLVAKEMERLLDEGGEFYLDLCDQSGWMFTKSGYPHLDDSTVISQEEGPEFGIPHLCVTKEMVKDIFSAFEIVEIEQRISYDGNLKERYRHYWVLGRKRS